jgi:hypothetical protein
MSKLYTTKYAINFPPDRRVMKSDRHRDAELAFLLQPIKTAANDRQDCPEAYIRLRIAGRRIYKPVQECHGRIHTADFEMIFCSTPDCRNFCETEENTLPKAGFKCRGCNKSGHRRIGIQPHQFDKSLRGHAPGAGSSYFVHTPSALSARSVSKRNAKRELKNVLDSNDSMLADGHQVKKDRRVDRECPEWMCDRFEFLNFLIGAHPKMLDEKNPLYRKHRETAALWAGVMCLYHRSGLPASHVAELLSFDNLRELPDGTFEIVETRNITEEQVERIVLAIRRRRDGLRVDGKALNGKRGRPKRISTAGINKLVEMLDSEGINMEFDNC